MEFTLALPGALLPSTIHFNQRQALLADLSLPKLTKILGRAHSSPSPLLDQSTFISPIENWLARCFSVPQGVIAPYTALLDHMDLPPSAVWLLQPIHLHIARDHLVLTDPDLLTLTADEAHSLLASIQPLLTELGAQVYPKHPQLWYLTHTSWNSLNTATLSAALGQNIHLYLPHGRDGILWKRIMNEIQMIWHTHPINELRETKQMLRVNSLWLYGGGQIPAPDPIKKFDIVYSNMHYARALAYATNAKFELASHFPKLTEATSLMIDPRLELALSVQDWFSWRQTWQQLEQDFLVPLLDLLGKRILKRFTLILCGQYGIKEVTITPQDLWKFWRRKAIINQLTESV